MTGRPTTEEALAAVGVARELNAEAVREHSRAESKPRTRLFRGSIDGREVLVTLHDPEGYGEIAFREDGRWGVPSELSEEL